MAFLMCAGYLCILRIPNCSCYHVFRNCIGQNFAMNEIKVVIARALLHFSLDVVPNKRPTRKISAVTAPADGLYLKLTPRQSDN